MSPILIIIAAFIGVTALVGGVALLLGGNSEERLQNRLSQLTTGKKGPDKAQSVLRDGALDAFKSGGGILDRISEKLSRMNLLFEQADTSLDGAKFLLVSMGIAAGSVAPLVATGVHPGSYPVAAVIGGAIPLAWLMWRRKRRLKKFGSQLPDALELMSRALRAGHSLGAGFQLVGSEMSQPIAKEMSRVFEEQNLGIPLDEALEGLTDRVPNTDLKFFCTAIILQRQTGGDLAEILDKIGRLIRERFQIWGQIQALTGEGRLSGVVLLALPPVLFLAVYKLNPDYVMVLFTDPLGKQMLLGALVMQVIGALVIRKIVNIKV